MCVFVLVCGHIVILYYAFENILLLCGHLPGLHNGKTPFVGQGLGLGLGMYL